MDRIQIFTGNAHRALALAICECMKGDGIKLGEATVGAFSDGETKVAIGPNVRGVDTYVVQPTCAPVNQNLMELMVMVDALRRASAGCITAVIPYYGYGRQDRKPGPRTPITAKLVADLLVAAGVDRIVSVDLHATQIQGFIDEPWDNLFARPSLLPLLTSKYEGVCVVSPDAGGVERARAYSKRLNGTLAIIDKRRERANESEVMHIVGEVSGLRCLIVDDMIDTAGTLVHAAEALMAAGAKSVAAAATHPVLSGPAVARIAASPLDEVIVTDTIPLSDAARASGRFHVVTVAPLIAEAIRRIHHNDSVSSLFD